MCAIDKEQSYPKMKETNQESAGLKIQRFLVAVRAGDGSSGSEDDTRGKCLTEQMKPNNKMWPALEQDRKE